MRQAPTWSGPVRLLVLLEITSGCLQFGLVPLLPAIGDRLDVSDAELSWVIAVQLLSAAVCVPVLGRLGDRHGYRRVLRVSVLLLAAGTLLVALAPSFPALLAGRVAQGPLAALLPLEIALVRAALPVETARRAIARLVGGLTLGALLGSVATGAVASITGDVRLALLLPAAMTIACVPLCFANLPQSPRRPEVRMDWPGAVLLAAGTVSLLVGLSESGHPGFAAAGVVLLVVFGAVQWRAADPLIDVRAMSRRQVLPYYGASALFGVAYFGSKAPNSAFLAARPEEAGYGFGLGAFAISLVLLPGIVFSIVTSLSTARLARRLGYRACVVIAFAVLAAGFVALASARGSLPAVCLATAIIGAGIGLAMGALPTVIVEGAPEDRSGIAAALYNNSKVVGGALAGGGLAALTAQLTPAGTGVPAEESFIAVWLIAATCAAVAAATVARGGSGRAPAGHLAESTSAARGAIR
ncbi:MFS transporter [Actinoplanes sp. NPDC026670]|uniref:MFS transporter n=1 Tax=Actinoplanes sp. NPDC026670 TaxID=3154700 RepID=UPI0033CCBAAE